VGVLDLVLVDVLVCVGVLDLVFVGDTDLV